MSHQNEQPEHQLHNEISIDTLRTPPLRIKPAHLRHRLVSALIDSAIIALVWFVLMIATGLDVRHFVGSGLCLVIVTFVYYCVFEGFTSTTIGKNILKLRVVGRCGDPASVREVLLRNAFRFVDWLPISYLVGLAFIFTSKQKQRIGDLVAGTFVTPAPEKDINPPPAPFLFH